MIRCFVNKISRRSICRSWLNTFMIILFVCSCISVLAQTSSTQRKGLQIIDISQAEIRILTASKNLDSAHRSKLLIDSLYKPYKDFWNGYVGQEDSFLDWMINTAIPALGIIIKKNEKIDGSKLFTAFKNIAVDMQKLTGYEPSGKWYIVYGPAWTDLGGLGSEAMLIDLSHQANSSAEQIIKMLPHELTHQIMTKSNKTKDSSALSTIIGEGFAVYMNEVYWKKKYSPAENLGYSEAEYYQCFEQKKFIKDFFQQHYKCTADSIIQKFRNRSIKINDGLPGAIGYFIGYEIVRMYVIRYGKNSWKDVFIKSPQEIYTKSFF